MTKTRAKIKGRRDSGSFIAIPHALLEHPNYAKLSHRAARLLWDLFAQYKGNNNGDLCAAPSILKSRGWNSNDQIYKGLAELLGGGWIEKTRQGHLPNVCSLYAVTFQNIDECGGKLSIKTTPVASGNWKTGYPVPKLVPDNRSK